MRVEPSTSEVLRETLALIPVVARLFGWTRDDERHAESIAYHTPAALRAQLRVWAKMKPGPEPRATLSPVTAAMDCPLCGRPAGTCDCHGAAQ